MQPVKRSPRPGILQRCTPALAAFAALLALAAAACDRGGALPHGGAHGASASQARTLSPPPAPLSGASGVPGVPGTPGEAPTNELMPRSQSVKIGNAPPAPVPGVRHGEIEENDLAARERRLSRQPRAAAASVGTAASGATGVPGAAGAISNQGDQGEAGAPAGAGPEAEAEPGSAPSMAAGAPGGLAPTAGEPGPMPAPAPEAKPGERQPPVPVTVPAGTSFEVELTKGLASNASSVGETFRARLVADLRLDGALAIPAGSEVLGVVTDAVGARRIGGKARLTVKFTDLVLFLEEGKSRAGRDTATIGGSTAGGALLGRILGNGGRGTILGALVGAAVGTAIASKTAGEEVVIPEGSVISLKLDQPLAVAAIRRTRAAE